MLLLLKNDLARLAPVVSAEIISKQDPGAAKNQDCPGMALFAMRHRCGDPVYRTHNVVAISTGLLETCFRFWV